MSALLSHVKVVELLFKRAELQQAQDRQIISRRLRLQELGKSKLAEAKLNQGRQIISQRLRLQEWANNITPQPPSSRFINLPAEIRLQIWKWVIYDLVNVPGSNYHIQWFDLRDGTFHKAETFYRLCRQAYVDLNRGALLYRHCEFRFSNLDFNDVYLSRLDPFHQKAIRNIELTSTVEDRKEWKHRTALNPWPALARCTGLRHFRFRAVVAEPPADDTSPYGLEAMPRDAMWHMLKIEICRGLNVVTGLLSFDLEIQYDARALYARGSWLDYRLAFAEAQAALRYRRGVHLGSDLHEELYRGCEERLRARFVSGQSRTKQPEPFASPACPIASYIGERISAQEIKDKVKREKKEKLQSFWRKQT